MKKEKTKKKKKIKTSTKKKQTKIIVRRKPDGYSDSMSTLVENAESQLLLNEIQGQIVDKLAYSFKGQNKKVEGLTFWGLEACTKFNKRDKWSPVWTEPKYQPLFNDSVLLTIGCINKKTKQTEWGNCTFNPKQRFAERTALTNAKRYALDKHISIPQKISFVQFLLKYKPKQILQKPIKVSKSKVAFTVSDTGKVKSKKDKDEEEEVNL